MPNLPGFVVLCPGLPVADVSNWRAAFLPGVYQGTHIDTRKTRVEELLDHMTNKAVTKTDQRRQLDLLAELNRKHQEQRAEDAALEARIQSFELAYRMQSEATDAFDVSKEPQRIRDMYGNGVHGRQLLIARRLVDAAVARRAVLPRRRAAVGQPRQHRKNHRHLAKESTGRSRPCSPT